jgi:Electron transfer DM13
MKKFIYLFAIVAMGLSSCSKDAATITVDSSKPDGTFTATKSGTFVAGAATTAGAVQLGKDSKGVQFLKFGSDFTTNFGTGTVSIYLSTMMTFDPAGGNPNGNLKLVGPALKAGETYFKIDPAADPKYTYVIAWCGSANVSFGTAKLN